MKGMKIGKKVSSKFPVRNKKFLTEKLKVSHSETKCFSQRNKVFLTEKQSVSHSETNCFVYSHSVSSEWRLYAGVDLDATDNDGNTALTYAIENEAEKHNATDMVALLKAAGAQ